jgi:hypothetical protein
MSLVGRNTITLNHASVVSILQEHLSKMFGPGLPGVVIRTLDYDDKGDGVSIQFTPETPLFKDASEDPSDHPTLPF